MTPRKATVLYLYGSLLGLVKHGHRLIGYLGGIRLVVFLIGLICTTVSVWAQQVEQRWEAIPGCKCNDASQLFENQSYGLLFSHKSKDGDPVVFPVDFGGVNRMAFQIDNIFYEHEKKQLRVADSDFIFPVANQFLEQANRYDVLVDLLISSDNGRALSPTSPQFYEKQSDPGNILILVNDIKTLLLKNNFDGVTLDFDRIFHGEMVNYRKVLIEVIKTIRSTKGLKEMQINVIVSDRDLISEQKFMELENQNNPLLNSEKLKENRLFLRILSGDRDEETGLSRTRLMIRAHHFYPLKKSNSLVSECGFTEGFSIQSSLRYQKGLGRSLGGRFSVNNVFPLLSLSKLKQQLAESTPLCRDKYFNAFAISPGYKGIAFEEHLGVNTSEISVEGFGKVFPDQSSATAAPDTVEAEKKADKLWSDLSFISMIQDPEKMSYLKRQLQLYCPECCNYFCPFHELIITINIGLLGSAVTLLVLSVIYYSINIMMKRFFLIYSLVVILLTALFQLLILCVPALVDYHDSALIGLVVVIVIVVAYSQYQTIRKSRFP